jgi:ketosteroid isomerase-like protein
MNPAVGISISLFAALVLSSSPSAQSQTDKPSFSFPKDSAAIIRTTSQFHSALKRGDTATIRKLLARDLLVLEGGEVETREQYLANHLAADIEFAKAVRETRTPVSYTREGNVAWLVSTSTASGSFRGRDINSVGAELLILSRTNSGWQIRAIHWSSARRSS